MENRYSIGFALRRSQNNQSSDPEPQSVGLTSNAITANMRYRRESSSSLGGVAQGTGTGASSLGGHSGTGAASLVTVSRGRHQRKGSCIASNKSGIPDMELPSYLKHTAYGERFVTFNGSTPNKGNYSNWLLGAVNDDYSAYGLNKPSHSLTSLSSSSASSSAAAATSSHVHTSSDNVIKPLNTVDGVNPATVNGTQFHLPQIFTSRLAAQLDALNSGGRQPGPGNLTSLGSDGTMAADSVGASRDRSRDTARDASRDTSRDAHRDAHRDTPRDLLLADLSPRYEGSNPSASKWLPNNITSFAANAGKAKNASAEMSLAARSRARLSLLPYGWAKKDSDSSVILSGDDCTVEFMADGRNTVHETIAVRTLDYIPTLCGVYYFEVEIGGTPNTTEDAFTIGLCDEDFSMNKLPGFESNSWGYHGDDGRIMASGGTAKTFGPTFGFGNVIGCGVNFYEDCIFYTKDGVLLGTAFEDILSNVNRRRLYPVIGMKSGRISRTNFGQLEFRFDIDHYVKEAKNKIMDEILASENERDNMNDLAKDIVASYFKHVGYFESAKAFSEDIAYEKSAQLELEKADKGSVGVSLPVPGSSEVDMEDAAGQETAQETAQESDHLPGNSPSRQGALAENEVSSSEIRQKARNLVVDGDIDGAILLLEEHFPSVLSKESVIYFEMRCHKFIELIRAASVSSSSSSSSSAATRKSKAKNEHLLTKAIEYGQKLRQDYKDDERPEIKRVMSIIFSLLAYEDPTTAPEVYKVFTKEGLVPLADGLNAAILVSQGGSSVPFLESLVQQSIQVTWEMSDHKNHKADLINVHEDFLNNQYEVKSGEETCNE